MREYGSNINLPSLDNLFSSEQERQDAKLEKIQILPLTELHPFRNHPFQVRDDDEMDKMVDSIKEYGVMTPAIVRPRKDGGYEIDGRSTSGTSDSRLHKNVTPNCSPWQQSKPACPHCQRQRKSK